MSGRQHECNSELCAELRLAAVPDLYGATAQAAVARDASLAAASHNLRLLRAWLIHLQALLLSLLVIGVTKATIPATQLAAR